MRAAVVGGGLAGLRGRARAGGRGARGHAATRRGRRSAARCRRCPSARATRRRRPTTASTSRSAASRRTGASSSGSARRARSAASRSAAGDRRARSQRGHRTVGARAARAYAPPAARATGSGSLRALALRGLDPPRTTTRRLPTSLRRARPVARAIDRFWDVFIRPALNLPLGGGERGGRRSSPSRRRCSATGATRDLLLPAKPLGEMHGEAAGRALREAGADGASSAPASTSLDELDADAIVVAVPPRESGAPARRAGTATRGLADRQRPPLFDRVRSSHARCSAARQRRALGLRPRRAHRPPARRGQYLTVVSSRARPS